MKDLRKIRNPIDMMVKGEKMDDFAYTAKTEQKTNFIYTMLGDILLDDLFALRSKNKIRQYRRLIND